MQGFKFLIKWGLSNVVANANSSCWFILGWSSASQDCLPWSPSTPLFQPWRVLTLPCSLLNVLVPLFFSRLNEVLTWLMGWFFVIKITNELKSAFCLFWNPPPLADHNPAGDRAMKSHKAIKMRGKYKISYDLTVRLKFQKINSNSWLDSLIF